jgi:hypothetical protein
MASKYDMDRQRQDAFLASMRELERRVDRQDFELKLMRWVLGVVMGTVLIGGTQYIIKLLTKGTATP